MNRRDFLQTTAATLAVPCVGETRERQIGCGYSPTTDELVHQEFATERWNGSQWVDTHERRMWWLQNGERIEKRWKLSRAEVLKL
jgi:hypothetical protein